MQPSTSSGSSTPRTYGSSVSPSDLGRHSARSVIDIERPSREPTSSQSMLSHYTPGGPVVFGENMSLECFLLGRNASLLVNALRESRFTTEHLAYLDHDVCTAVRIIRDEVSTQLNDIYKYLLDRLQREQINSASSSSTRPSYVANPFSVVTENPINRTTDDAFSSVSQGQPSRDTVICPPRMLSLPMYNPYVNQQ